MGWLSKKEKSDTDNPWRQRYFEELDQLEQQLSQAREAQDALRRLCARLCLAGKGQSALLDPCLGEIQGAVRKPLSPTSIDELMTALTEAVERMDSIDKTAQPKVQAKPESELTPRVKTACKILIDIIDQLQLHGEVREQAGKLRARLYLIEHEEKFNAGVRELADILKQQHKHQSERAQHFQALLKRMTQRLDEVTEHLEHDEQSRHQNSQNSQTLNQSIAREMMTLNQASRDASDLNSLQREVEAKIAKVDQHMTRFRQRELEIAAVYRERADRLKGRITELEGHTVTLESAMQKQRERALIDSLTGIPNREAWAQAALRYFKQYREMKRPLTLAIWDIDHFKSINDNHGHQAGDKALQQVARHLHQALAAPAFIARVGGEEFACFLPNHSAKLAAVALNNIRLTLADLSVQHANKRIDITASCGLTEILPNDTLDRAYARADTALYEAKRAGRNRVNAYTA